MVFFPENVVDYSFSFFNFKYDDHNSLIFHVTPHPTLILLCLPCACVRCNYSLRTGRLMWRETVSQFADSLVCSGLNLFLSMLFSPGRCLRSVGRGPCRRSPGEIPVCFRGVCEESVPQPAKQVWEAAPSLAVPPHRLLFCHRAALLCASCGENAHWNSYKGHATVRQQLQLALYAYSVKEEAVAALLRSGEGLTPEIKSFFSAQRKISVDSNESEELPVEWDY